MEAQNYTNHRRLVPGFHLVLSLLLFAGFAAGVVNVYRSWPTGNLFNAVLILLLFGCAFLMSWFIRAFPIKAQDRAIRAEESLRYFILTGKQLSPQLTMGQIVALRFAADDELIELTAKALAENLSPEEIKKAVRNWRADHHRV
jgi:hypothetical protein